MRRIRLKPQHLAFVALIMLLCAFAGSVGAKDDLTWPVETRLIIKDWNDGAPDAWMEIGRVDFVNGHHVNGALKITIDPFDPYKVGEVRIHVVQDPDDFASVLDKKTGTPKAGQFDYKTNYLADEGVPVDIADEFIPLSNFEICWGPNPETCPPLYAIVSVLLYEPQEVDGITTWLKVPENAYAEFAESGGVFESLSKDDGRIWGTYANYPPAKVEPGHFVDAIVNGLGYVTITQTNFGTTGEGGQFWYLPGEQVAFYAGSLFLGDALGDRQVSPPDLFEDADPVDGADTVATADKRVLNMARLLQSLDADGNAGLGAINITEPVVACLESALDTLDFSDQELDPEHFFNNDDDVEALISATITACAETVELKAVSKEVALQNLNFGTQAGNLMKRNISKTPGLKSDKAKIEIMPVYVPAQRPDGTAVNVPYFDADGNEIETRGKAKPIVVAYLDEVEGTGAFDTFVAISRDDGDSWKRRNISKTADKSSLLGYPGKSEKPMLKVKDNMIFVAWTDKYCRGGRPGYAITVCPEDEPGCTICRDTAEGEICSLDYPGDDVYWQDDIFGVGGPQRSVLYEDEPGAPEIPYSCVWAARGVIEPSSGDIQWFKPERLTSGRRDAFQLFAGAGEDVAFAIVWQEDPKGLMPGEGDGPGDGWSGANTHSKTDIWYSYIKMSDFALVDEAYSGFRHGDADFVDVDSDLVGRVKALVPMSLPVKISDNDVCSAENIAALGGSGEHDNDEEGEGTHGYCDTAELCAYTVEKANPKGEIHNVCVTADGRLLDGNTGASRANVFLQPFKPASGPKSAYAIIGYEESKGVGSPPEDEEGCGDEAIDPDDVDHEDRYKPDSGKNIIYHSFKFDEPVTVSAGDILNLPETTTDPGVYDTLVTDADEEPVRDADGNLLYYVYLVNEDGSQFLDWEGKPVLATENARRIRFVTQPKSKMGGSKTVLVALYRQGEEGSGKPADIFMRSIKAPDSGNPYAFKNFRAGAQNLSSVEPTKLWQNPLDEGAPVKMLRWGWTASNLADSSGKHPYSDSRAHRGALNGDDLIIGYTWTPNWGRKANDKYDFYVRRSFNGGQDWTTDPAGVAIEHNVVFREPVVDENGDPILDEDSGHVIWDEVVVTTPYAPGAAEPPRNVSNLRNNRTSVLEPRLVKTPGTILTGGVTLYPEDESDSSVYQVAWGLEFNQNQAPVDVVYPKQPLDIYYGQTMDKGQRYESVVITPQGGNGKPEEGFNPLAKDHPEQGAAQLRQTPDGSRMYGIWLEETADENGHITDSDIMFRRVDYRD